MRCAEENDPFGGFHNVPELWLFRNLRTAKRFLDKQTAQRMGHEDHRPPRSLFASQRIEQVLGVREETVLVGAAEPLRNLGIIAVCEDSHVATVVFAHQKVAWPVYVFLPACSVGRTARVVGYRAPRRLAVDSNGPISITIPITTSDLGK